VSKVADFKPATKNANKHSARGLGALAASIQGDGWIGAMTTAADGEMIAGSARLETSAQVFGVDAEPIIIESDGTRPIIVKRTDIPDAADKRAVRLALADNRVQELDLSWDVEVLAGLDAATLDGLWTADELSDLGQQWAEGYGDTSTDRAKQGVGSTWGQVNGTDNVAVRIGEIETRLTGEIYAEFETVLNRKFSVNQKPFHETFAELIEHGLTLFGD
jgi:hypothetical protein